MPGISRHRIIRIWVFLVISAYLNLLWSLMRNPAIIFFRIWVVQIRNGQYCRFFLGNRLFWEPVPFGKIKFAVKMAVFKIHCENDSLKRFSFINHPFSFRISPTTLNLCEAKISKRHIFLFLLFNLSIYFLHC